MVTRPPFEEKYAKPKRKPTDPLNFLLREPQSVDEQLLKADMLLSAIQNKNIKYAKEIIDSPGDPSYIDFRLHDQSVHDYRAPKTYERNYHISPYPTNLPRTALTLACYYGLTDVVKSLIDKGANVNLTSSSYSPLEYANHCRKQLGNEAAPLSEYYKISNLLRKNGATFNENLRACDDNSILPTIEQKKPAPSNFLITRKVKVQPLVEDKIELELIKKMR